MAEVIIGDSMILMPAVSALLASPSESAFAARWVVMSDEEQAVSIPMHGPARQRRELETAESSAGFTHALTSTAQSVNVVTVLQLSMCTFRWVYCL